MSADSAGSESDAVLVARSGIDPEAFEHVVERHHAPVFRYVLSRLGPDAVEDVVADTFVTAFATRHRFDPSRATSALPWLLGIATKRIARQREQQARWLERCAAAAASSTPDASDDSDRAVERADARSLSSPLATALATLSKREREPLLLHVLGGLSYEEVATALAIPTGTVRSRISRATNRLAGLLDGVTR